MASGDPDAPNHKRLRLDSGNPVLNGHPPRPPPPPPAQRHPSLPSHPTSTQASSPPPARHYPPHSLPPPTYPSPGPSHFAPPQPSPSLPPSDIRHLSDPRNIPSPGHRTHGLPGTPVTLPARNNIPQDSISTYRPPPAPQSTAAPDLLPSRSASLDAKPHMEPGPWPGNPEHRHGSISNGYSAAMSPPNLNEPPFHTPPLQPGQHYGQPPPAAYTPAPYMGQYVPGPGQMRRKQVRATQACNHCRARKQKCDEARPCQFCRENNFDCQYKDVPPPKQDRSMMALQDGINNISDTLQNFIDTFSVWKQGVESRLATRGGEGIHMGMDHVSPGQNFAGRGSIGDGHSSRMPTPNQARSQLRRADSIKTESPTAHHSHASPVAAYTSTPGDHKSILATPQPPATPADSVDHSLPPPESAPRGLLEGLQSDHTTPAHLLLAEWSQMGSFCNGIPELEKLVDSGKKIADYPMQFEQDRGLIRVWGVGEGKDSNDGAQGPSSPESNVDSDAPSPGSTKEGIWGYPPVDHSSPSTLGGETPRYYSDLGGLGPDGKPDFRIATLQSLRTSYHEHIHCLHPFVNPSKLRKMVTDFGAVYSPEAQKSRTKSPANVPERLNPGVKRKRSSSVLGDSYGLAEDLSRGSIERSLRNAIVLLVLALGKVCQHIESLPAPQADRSSASSGNWGYTRDSPHSTNHSFSSDDSDSRPRNIDVLPGMAYFSYATDILGNQQGGNTVAHAQAMLLAALYLSQFARVLESWSWINNACRVCLVLVKADYPKLSRPTDLMTPREPDPPKEVFRLNLVKCVYWTCLQLETDILAEMSTLPPTEVSKYQDDILYPSGVYEKFPDDLHIQDDSDDHILFIYSSLIHLRVVLNGAHNTLYGKNRKTPMGYNGDSIRDVGSQVGKIVEILKIWRSGLPANLSWSDRDPPSTDINIARLRAKYYGGLYMVLRPVLRIAVKNLEPDPHRKEVPQDPVAENQRYMGLIQECIESAIRSTIAFDRVGADPASAYPDFTSKRRRRLILTNIVGTLHAQFGNMLILAAVYKSPLQKYLPQGPEPPMFSRTNLSILFHRTIAILEEVATNSPILRTDLKILENARRELGL